MHNTIIIIMSRFPPAWYRNYPVPPSNHNPDEHGQLNKQQSTPVAHIDPLHLHILLVRDNQQASTLIHSIMRLQVLLQILHKFQYLIHIAFMDALLQYLLHPFLVFGLDIVLFLLGCHVPAYSEA